MRQREIKELHNIMPIGNVETVMRYGILCFDRANKLKHASVALNVIQERRDNRRVPDGKALHTYANLYFNARNPMMYLRRGKHNQLYVLRINPSVMDLPGVVVTDGNASSDWTYFGSKIGGLRKLDESRVFAESWTDDNVARYWEKKRQICAEVLVPGKVSIEFIMGAYVSGESGLEKLKAVGFQLPIEINEHLFFRN